MTSTAAGMTIDDSSEQSRNVESSRRGTFRECEVADSLESGVRFERRLRELFQAGETAGRQNCGRGRNANRREPRLLKYLRFTLPKLRSGLKQNRREKQSAQMILTETGTQIDLSAAHVEKVRLSRRDSFEPDSKETFDNRSREQKQARSSVSSEDGRDIEHNAGPR
jgi:hypothetical protein